jgi:hypothetical protein
MLKNIHRRRKSKVHDAGYSLGLAYRVKVLEYLSILFVYRHRAVRDYKYMISIFRFDLKKLSYAHFPRRRSKCKHMTQYLIFGIFVGSRDWFVGCTPSVLHQPFCSGKSSKTTRTL